MASPQTFPLDTICKLLDLTPQRINQLVNEGVLPRKERGRYELVPVVRAYIRYLRDRAIKGDTATGDDYATHRARLTKAKADMAEMEREQMRNNLIPASDVMDAWDAMASNMRAKLLSIPTKSATTVFAASDIIEAKKILKDGINEALKELSAIEIKTNNPIRSTDAGDDGAKDDEDASAAAGTKDKRLG